MDALTHLAHSLKDDDHEVSTKAVDAIATLVQISPGLGVDAITNLEQALKDDDKEVRTKVVSAIGTLV